MAASMVYKIHPYQHIALCQAERELITASPVPINIFWVNHMDVNMQVKNCPTWPHNRSYMSLTGKTMVGVCVAYQTEGEPLASLGSHGDLWVMPQAMFIKTASGSWTPWNRKVKYPCPFDTSRRLAWTYNAHFKYITGGTVRRQGVKLEERARRGSPIYPIPEHGTEESTNIRAAIEKPYKALTEHDCVLILNAYLNNLRRRSEDGDGLDETDGELTQNHNSPAADPALPGQGHTDHSSFAERRSSSLSSVDDLGTQETGHDVGISVDSCLQQTPMEPNCHSVDSACDDSEDEVDFILFEPYNRSSITGQSLNLSEPATLSLNGSPDVTKQRNLEVHNDLETARRQLKEQTSVLRHLADTLDTESHLQDRNWFDRTTPDLHDITLAARKILSRNHSSS